MRLPFFLLCCVSLIDPSRVPAQTYTIETVAGGAFPDSIEAKAIQMTMPAGIAADASGNIYIVLTNRHVVVRLDRSGKLTRVAGTGVPGYNGDGGDAAKAQLSMPQDVAVDSSGDLYIADTGNERVRKVSGGTIATVAGSGAYGFSGDGGTATAARLWTPMGVAVDAGGNLYISDSGNRRIRKVSNGVISTVAGNGGYGYSGDNDSAVKAQLADPLGIAVDSAGSLYFCDTSNNRIRKVTSGIITTYAGGGTATGDGGPAAEAQLNNPVGITFDSSGNLFVTDTKSYRVRSVSPKGVITTVAGNGLGWPHATYLDNVPATATSLDFGGTERVAVDAAGAVYFGELNQYRIRRVAGGMITTVAGSASATSTDTGPALSVQVLNPTTIVLDATSKAYFAANNRVYRIANGVVTRVAGGGSAGDGGAATDAALSCPLQCGLALDSAGDLYIRDSLRVHKVAGGIITAVAGGGSDTTDGAAAAKADLACTSACAIAVDAGGTIYLCGDARIRKVANGTVTNVAGTGVVGYSGDGGPATSAQFNGVAALATDPAGNLYVADEYNGRIRKVAGGIVTTVAGGGSKYPGTAPALEASIPRPRGVAVDASGNLYVAESANSHIYRLTAGALTRIAGGGSAVNATSALAARLSGPTGIAVNSAGEVWFADTGNNTIQKLVPWAAAPQLAGGGIVGAGGSVPAVQAAAPYGLITIWGSNFAPEGTVRFVGSRDLVNGAWPTNLAGICVLVNGTEYAPVFQVLPSQVGAQVPALAAGSTAVFQVLRNCGTSSEVASNPLSVAVQETAPEFFYFVQNANGVNSIAALNAITGERIGKPGLIPGVSFTPAKPGDWLALYGTGFGVTSPAYAPGAIPGGAAATVQKARVRFGGVSLNDAQVIYTGIAPGIPGEYQVNLQVPPGLADGDYSVVVEIGGASTPAGGYISVKNGQ